MIFVLQCPRCEQFNIVSERTETVLCPYCNTQQKFKKYKIVHKADSEEEARKARSKAIEEENKVGFGFQSNEEFKKEMHEDASIETIIRDKTPIKRDELASYISDVKPHIDENKADEILSDLKFVSVTEEEDVTIQ